MQKREFYKGKYFSVLGDSVSTLSGFNPEERVFYTTVKSERTGIRKFEDTWWGMVISELNGKLLVNDSYSGSTVCKLNGMEVESYGSSDVRTSDLGNGGISPDVIMINMGSNDCGHGVQARSSNGKISFSEGYALMLSKLRKNYPDAQIWCLTLGDFVWVDFDDPNRVVGRKEIDIFNEIIIEQAHAFGCELINVTGGSLHYNYTTIDGVHPTKEGMRAIAENVLSQVIEN